MVVHIQGKYRQSRRKLPYGNTGTDNDGIPRARIHTRKLVVHVRGC